MPSYRIASRNIVVDGNPLPHHKLIAEASQRDRVSHKLTRSSFGKQARSLAGNGPVALRRGASITRAEGADDLFEMPGYERGLKTAITQKGVRLTQDGKVLLKALSFQQLEQWVVEIGERPGRAIQTWAWLYQENKWAKGAEEMQEVSKDWKERLATIAEFGGRIQLRETRVASDGTRKLLFEVESASGGNGGIVEAVMIPAPSGRLTVCISSQVGCAMNCQFCFTGRMGLRGNLTTEQIVEQVVEAKRIAAAEGMGKVTNVVFMGMGEPLHNVEAVIDAVDILASERGLALSSNKITVSTSGLVPQIVQFCRRSPATLAVSLNATTDEVRNWLMPINRKWPLGALMQTLRDEFPRGDGRGQKQVFFEYIMLKDINDSDEDAERLLALTEDLPCKVNLICFNAHDGAEFFPSEMERVRAFRDIVASAGRVCTIRESRGDDASAACGQLGSVGDMLGDGPSPQRPPRLKPPVSLRAAVEVMREQRPVKV
eukprot:CAMPEP_0198219994 /NCGR_PEP_ID=MMETSP1445-20131203/77128_1 /TAXON_ID=36898 /ORGANISM="Pyramimonas sp., Strain CCMP2087" /LENGTH=487 /DNA_ID=CAMNT_0043897605 /DNA_START=237 /DNA_END=1700 /DNA_ORIENTATION=+